MHVSVWACLPFMMGIDAGIAVISTKSNVFVGQGLWVKGRAARSLRKPL